MNKEALKATESAPAKASDKNALTINEKSESENKKRQASNGLSTTVLNSVTAREFSKSTVGEIDIIEAIAVMRDKVSKVNAGDLSALESTLTAQATTLDTVFNSLARRANISDTITKLEIYMRLALKAQAQCARTIEVLATMKNPPVVFAKQANITSGNQQINNGSLPNSLPTHAGKNINQSNELLEVQPHDEWLDNGKKTTTSGDDKPMATLETQHGG